LRGRTTNPSHNAPIKAELVGADTCTACGITMKSDSPVLALWLVDAGHDPVTPLEAYRGDVLCLRVRSIGQAARMQVNGSTRLVFAGLSGPQGAQRALRIGTRILSTQSIHERLRPPSLFHLSAQPSAAL
jgi:hypothetical protein